MSYKITRDHYGVRVELGSISRVGAKAEVRGEVLTLTHDDGGTEVFATPAEFLGEGERVFNADNYWPDDPRDG